MTSVSAAEVRIGSFMSHLIGLFILTAPMRRRRGSFDLLKTDTCIHACHLRFNDFDKLW